MLCAFRIAFQVSLLFVSVSFISTFGPVLVRLIISLKDKAVVRQAEDVLEMCGPLTIITMALYE